MTWWLNWLILISGTFVLFVVYGRLYFLTLWLDSIWSRGNDIGRPFLNTIILTGLPALYAKLADTPLPGLLIPLTFFLTQTAVLGGRFLNKEFNVAGYVMVLTTFIIWVAFFVT